MPNAFSYSEYMSIIEYYKLNHSIMDFSHVSIETEQYCVIRHDVEFSVDRALSLAQFESNVLDINSTYLFQIRNNCYNLASDVNLEKIYAIHALGHKVGLHIHLGLACKDDELNDYILNEAQLFEALTGLKVDRFSYHRPNASILKDYLEIPGLINCYDKKFFHHYDIPHNNLDVKYFTDSRHSWQHGHPLQEKHQKVQILTHPYSWTETGHSNTENYRSLLIEKDNELRESINRETSTFPKELHKPFEKNVVPR